MKSEKNSVFTLVIIFIFGIVLLVMTADEIDYIFTGKTTDVNEMIADGREPEVGDHVSIELDYVIDWYAELTQSRKGIKKVTYHAMGVLDDGRIISICVKKDSEEYDKIDDLIEETYDYLAGISNVPPTSVKLEGTVRKIDSEISSYYTTGLSYIGYTSSDAISLDIDVTQKRIYVVLMFVFAIGMTVVPVILGLKEYNEYKASKNRKMNNIVPEPTNDPVFNKSFYDTYSLDNSNEKYVEETDDGIGQDENSSQELHTDDTSNIESKFSLKKD